MVLFESTLIILLIKQYIAGVVTTRLASHMRLLNQFRAALLINLKVKLINIFPLEST